MSGEFAIAILNRSKNEQTFSFNVDAVGLDAAKGYTAKDLWTKNEFPATTDAELTRIVAPHGVVVLKLKGTALPFNVFQFADKR